MVAGRLTNPNYQVGATQNGTITSAPPAR